LDIDEDGTWTGASDGNDGGDINEQALATSRLSSSSSSSSSSGSGGGSARPQQLLFALGQSGRTCTTLVVRSLWEAMAVIADGVTKWPTHSDGVRMDKCGARRADAVKLLRLLPASRQTEFYVAADWISAEAKGDTPKRHLHLAQNIEKEQEGSLSPNEEAALAQMVLRRRMRFWRVHVEAKYGPRDVAAAAAAAVEKLEHSPLVLLDMPADTSACAPPAAAVSYDTCDVEVNSDNRIIGVLVIGGRPLSEAPADVAMYREAAKAGTPGAEAVASGSARVPSFAPPHGIAGTDSERS
jgi:hypothetical protein